jgi:spindle and centriole-associated protein 1
MVTTDEQLISLTHAIKNCPVINNSRQESQAPERAAMGRRLVDNVGRWSLIIPRLLSNYLISLE